MEENLGTSEAQRAAEIQAEIAKAQEAEVAEVEDIPALSTEEVLRAELAEKDNRILRLQADFENFRRRTAKERAEVSAVVLQGVLTDMLPLIDNFERALAAEGKDVESFQKGVHMIFTQLQEIARKNGLEPIEAEGKAFDPNFHQAVMRVESAEHEAGTILQVLQKGYQAHGRVIRPAMVQVAES